METKIAMTMDEYEEMREEYCGICLNCGSIIFGGCEPDMVDGPCDECNMEKVMGIEQMLLEGRISFKEAS